MIYLRRISHPTTTPPPTPTSPAESFIRKKLSTVHCGDIRALAVSSIVIASSIGSPSLNKNHLPRSDEQWSTHTSHPNHEAIDQEPSPHQAADSAWRTAYSAARMIVNVTKESSDMFLPLKAVVGALSVLIKNYDQTLGNASRVEEIEERVLSLSDILRSPLREDDHSESARRKLLCGRLMDIVVKLEPLSEQNGLLKFLRNEDHTALLNGFVQDMACAITDYQTSLQQNTYENTRDIHEVARNIDQTTKDIAGNTADIIHKAKDMIEAADIEALDNLNPIHNAGYQADHHERCLSGTREPILRDTMHWAKNAQDQPVFWLNGLAGTGKSTIAQTFSEMANDDDILGASFFCSREYLERKVLKNIFPTLAYQLACRYPRFRDHLVKVIKRDPSVAHNSLISQLRNLVVDPLSATGISCVIVIDALDECVDDQPASAILSVLGRLVSKLPLVKFFITGRPEPRIRSGFRLPLLEPFTQIFLLHEVDPTSVKGDIRLYLTAKLTSIARRRSDLYLPEAWPSDEDIAVLAQKSSGLFIFAATVARFIESEHHEPRERLRLVVSKADDTSYEGASGIDSLYSQVLRDAFSGVNEESVFVNLKRILSAVVLALDPLSRDGLARLLNLDCAFISTTLRHLHSVILVPPDGSKEIRVFHKSFPDFLLDPDRCLDPRFHFESSTRHGDMALSCLDLVGKLRANPCSLAPFVMNQDVPDRPELLGDKLGSGLRYACKYWSIHLLSSPTSGKSPNRLTTLTSLFFDHNVFPWMEVMSLEGHLEDVIHSMNHLLDWLGKVGIADGPLLNLTKDCIRFTLHFFRPIQMSAQHIYHTALPLSPRASILRLRLFENHPSWEEDWTTQQTSLSSLPDTWGAVLRTIKADLGRFTHVAVAGQRIAAVCEDNTINVYDAVTGVLRLSLDAPQQATKAEGSSDGSVLFCAHECTREITLWDMQTGGLVHTFTTAFKISDIAVSMNGKYLASCSPHGTFGFWGVETRCGDSRFFDQPVVCIRWLEPEDQVALALRGTVMILEATTGRTLHTFSIRECVRGMTFSTGQRRLAVWSTFGIENTIAIIDIRSSSALVSSPPLAHVSCFAFSGNGDRVVCATKTGELWFFYILAPLFGWRDRQSHLETIYSIGLLRSGHLVVNVGGSIQLLETGYARPSGSSLDPEMARVYPLDDGKAICTSSRDRQDVNLLDAGTMETIAKYHIGPGAPKPSFSPIVYVSAGQRAVILCYPGLAGFTLEVQPIGSAVAKRVKYLLRPVISSALSPGGEIFITVMEGESPSGDAGWELWLGRVSDGSYSHLTTQRGSPPRKIAFASDLQFYTEGRHIRASSALPPDEDGEDHEDHAHTTLTPPATFERPSSHYRKPRTQSAQGTSASEQSLVHHNDCYVRKTFTLVPASFPSNIDHVSEEILPTPLTLPYVLDKSLEWVVDARSRRVCWLPPGYASEIEDGHCFVDSSIVLVGKDGIVRKLIFRKPRSDS